MEERREGKSCDCYNVQSLPSNFFSLRNSAHYLMDGQEQMKNQRNSPYHKQTCYFIQYLAYHVQISQSLRITVFTYIFKTLKKIKLVYIVFKCIGPSWLTFVSHFVVLSFSPPFLYTYTYTCFVLHEQKTNSLIYISSHMHTCFFNT